MQQTVYNPQKGRLETIDIAFTDDNTTWFDDLENNEGISLIADFEGCLVIVGDNYDYPILIYDLSRSDIHYDKRKAAALRQQYLQS